VPRAAMTTIDLSAPLNQGWGMLSRKQFYTSFANMFKYFKSEEAFKNLQADIITDPMYKTAKKAGLRITELGQNLNKREEVFMTTLLDKIPGVRPSQRAYTGFLNKLRYDVFKDLLEKANLAGEDINIGSKVSEDIAKTVNNFTGGAKLPGALEGAAPEVNMVFFSGRKIASTINMLNPWNYIDPKISKTAKKAALRNLIGSTAISITLIELAKLLGSDEPETDPRSSKIGKIKVGNSYLDVSGGNATYATLLSRLLSGKTKTQKGEVKPLGNKIGETSASDLISQGIRYKLSPNTSLIVDLLSGANAIGEEKTPTQSVIDRFRPMFLNSIYEEIKDDSNGSFVKALMAIGALFGGSLNTIPPVEPKNKKSVPIY